jgi:hypothetical protein
MLARGRFRVLLACTFGLAACFVVPGFAPSVALAQPSTAILGLRAAPGEEERSRELTDALRTQGADSDAWTLNETTASLDQMTMAHDCDGTTPECLDQVAAALGVDQIVVGELASSDDGGARAEVRLYERDSQTVAASGEASIAEGAAMSDVALDLLRQLGVIAAAEPEPEPEALAPVAAVAPVEQEPEPIPYEDDTPASLDWLGYLLVGVAIASAGGAVFSWVEIDQASSNEEFENYRKRVGEENPTTEDVCTLADDNYVPSGFDGKLSEVKDQCSVGATFEVLQYVFLGTAVVTGGIGAYVLISGDDDDGTARSSSSLAVRPRVGREGASVTATLRF